MVKKQALVALVTLMSIFGTAFGLGLGDIEVKSNLNDPLEAEIKLLQLNGLTAGEILPTLASNDDFRRAGVERSFFLSNIQFRTGENEAGELVIRLKTKQVVREPFLNFLVEVNWPSGRLLKEYTVLLDPPVFDTGLSVDALSVTHRPAATSQPATDLTTTTVVDSAEVTDVVTQPAVVQPRDDTLPAGKYRVQRNDTLWEIALKVPERSGYSPQQVMLAIQDVNPEAFLNGNINRVKAGSVITFPSAAQIGSRTLTEAVEEVQAQNRGSAPKLRAPVEESSASEVQLSATESTSSALPGQDGSRNPDGYLELTSESGSLTATASGETSAAIDQLQSQLAAAEELNDQYQRERADLESQVQDLQEQIQIMERLLEVQDSDLAEVQQAMATADEVEDSEMPSADEAASEDMTSSAVETAPVVTAPEPEPAVAPPPVIPPPVQPQPEPGFMGVVTGILRQASDWVLGSVVNMAVTGGVILVLILLPLYLRSKRSDGDQTLEELTGTADDVEPEITMDTDLDEDLLSTAEEELEDEDEQQPEILDAVVEAEMYMAYQKYDQAEEKLKEAFSEYPDRTDVAVKLLEVYSETGDAKAFNQLEAQLNLNAGQQAVVAELKAKMPEVDISDESDLVPGLLEDDLELDLGSADSRDGSGVDLDFDLDLDTDISSDDDDALDLDSGFSEEASTEESSLDMDLDVLSMDLTEESIPELSTETELDTDLDFSLDLDDLDATEEAPEITSNSDDLDISLDTDLETLTDISLPSESEQDLSSGDFELDLDVGDEPALTELEEVDLEEVDLEEADLEGLDFGGSGLELDTDVATEVESSLDLESEESAELGLDLGDLEEESSLAELDSLTETVTEEDETLALDIDNDSLGIDLGDLAESDIEKPAESVELEADPLQQLADSLNSDAELEEDEFDFLSGNDEASTKLDLARAYIEMDDKDGARDILEEVATEGNNEQKAQAEELLAQL